MNESKLSPNQLFGTSDCVQVTIDGIPTRVINTHDERGIYLAIEATHPELSNICGDIVLGKLITEIDYLTYQGRVAIIKAYY